MSGRDEVIAPEVLAATPREAFAQILAGMAFSADQLEEQADGLTLVADETDAPERAEILRHAAREAYKPSLVYRRARKDLSQ